MGVLNGDGNNCSYNKYKDIKEVTSTRYLGIIFDNNLRWNLYTQNIVRKLLLLLNSIS